MPDEAPVIEQDTPANDTEPEAPTQDTPEADDTEPEIDYRQRYESLRPEFDRTNQVLAALQGRHGPEAQAEAAKMFGFEFAEDEEEESDEIRDPSDEIAEIKRQLAERDQQAEAAQLEAAEQAWIQQELGKVAKSEDRDLTDEETDIIVGYALSNRFDDGQPDIEGGHERLKAIYSAAQKRLVNSKRAPRPPAGVAGADAIDTSTPEGRRKAIADIAEASFTSD